MEDTDDSDNIERLKNKLNEAKSTINLLLGEKKTWIETKSKSKDNVINELNLRLEKSRKSMQILKADKDCFVMKYANSEKSRNNLENDLKALKVIQKKTEDDLKREISSLNTLVVNLKKQNDDLKEETVELRTNKSDFELEIKALKDKSDGLEEELRELVQDSASFRETITELKSKCLVEESVAHAVSSIQTVSMDNLNKQIDTLSVQLNLMKKDTTRQGGSSSKLCTDHSKEIIRLRVQLDFKNENFELLKENYKTNLMELERTEKALSAALERCESIEEKSVENKKEMFNLELLVKRLREQSTLEAEKYERAMRTANLKLRDLTRMTKKEISQSKNVRSYNDVSQKENKLHDSALESLSKKVLRLQEQNRCYKERLQALDKESKSAKPASGQVECPKLYCEETENYIEEIENLRICNSQLKKLLSAYCNRFGALD